MSLCHQQQRVRLPFTLSPQYTHRNYSRKCWIDPKTHAHMYINSLLQSFAPPIKQSTIGQCLRFNKQYTIFFYILCIYIMTKNKPMNGYDLSIHIYNRCGIVLFTFRLSIDRYKYMAEIHCKHKYKRNSVISTLFRVFVWINRI